MKCEYGESRTPILQNRPTDKSANTPTYDCPASSQLTRHSQERSGTGHEPALDSVERVLYALDLPQMLEHLGVPLHALRVEHRVERRVDFIFERKHVPSDLALRKFEHARVKSTKRVGMLRCRCRTTKSSFECRGQIVTIQQIRGPVERGPGAQRTKVSDCSMSLTVTGQLTPDFPSRSRQSLLCPASGNPSTP